MNDEEATGGRRAALHARTRDEILDAAAGLVTERGADEFSLQEVAERAGFGNAASLYRYFTGKQEIMQALVARGLERLGEHMRSVPEDLAPGEQIVALCLAYLEYARLHPGERSLLLATAGSAAPDFRTAALPVGFAQRIFRLADAARADGMLSARDEHDVFVILHAVWALAHGMAEYDTLYQDPEREMLRRRRRAVFLALIAGFRGDWWEEGRG